MSDLDVMVFLWGMEKIQRPNEHDQEPVMTPLLWEVMPVSSKLIHRRGGKTIRKIPYDAEGGDMNSW